MQVTDAGGSSVDPQTTDPALVLDLGSMVEITLANSSPAYGVIRWMGPGHDPKITMCGLELVSLSLDGLLHQWDPQSIRIRYFLGWTDFARQNVLLFLFCFIGQYLCSEIPLFRDLKRLKKKISSAFLRAILLLLLILLSNTMCNTHVILLLLLPCYRYCFYCTLSPCNLAQ